MDSKAIREIQHNLSRIGFPIRVDGNLGPQTRRAVLDFKRGWAFRLPVLNRNNDNPGRLTRRALRLSVERDGRCSRHFRYREFKSKGDGWIKVKYQLVRGLEKYRARVGRGIAVVSGYRDPAHNKAVGGATSSQHLYGNAADLIPVLSVSAVRALGIFSGIGFMRESGLVRHVDVRHLGPNNLTGGRPSAPTTWIYG